MIDHFFSMEWYGGRTVRGSLGRFGRRENHFVPCYALSGLDWSNPWVCCFTELGWDAAPSLRTSATHRTSTDAGGANNASSGGRRSMDTPFAALASADPHTSSTGGQAPGAAGAGGHQGKTLSASPRGRRLADGTNAPTRQSSIENPALQVRPEIQQQGNAHTHTRTFCVVLCCLLLCQPIFCQI